MDAAAAVASLGRVFHHKGPHSHQLLPKEHLGHLDGGHAKTERGFFEVCPVRSLRFVGDSHSSSEVWTHTTTVQLHTQVVWLLHPCL